MCLTASRFGISTIVDIFSRISKNRGWLPDDDASPEEVAQKDKEGRFTCTREMEN